MKGFFIATCFAIYTAQAIKLKEEKEIEKENFLEDPEFIATLAEALEGLDFEAKPEEKNLIQ